MRTLVSFPESFPSSEVAGAQINTSDGYGGKAKSFSSRKAARVASLGCGSVGGPTLTNGNVAGRRLPSGRSVEAKA
jgi:hypothetical protein